MSPCERRSGAYAHEPVRRLHTRACACANEPTHTDECVGSLHAGSGCGGMGRAARGLRGAKERETPGILGDDGPVGPLAFLHALSHVAHTLGCSLVSQGYTQNRAHKVTVSILLAHSRRHSLTGSTSDRNRRSWREERVAPQTCKRPKQVRLHCLLGRSEVKELRTDEMQGCEVISQRGGIGRGHGGSV
jgi:hypothetical protein